MRRTCLSGMCTVPTPAATGAAAVAALICTLASFLTVQEKNREQDEQKKKKMFSFCFKITLDTLIVMNKQKRQMQAKMLKGNIQIKKKKQRHATRLHAASGDRPNEVLEDDD